MTEKILVTGATGFTGSEVVKQLAQKGANVVAGVRDIEKAGSMNWDGIEIVHYDYLNPATVAAALSGVDKIFFVTPAFDPANIRMAEIMANLVAESPIQHIVRLSEMDVEHEVSRGQKQMEVLIEDSGVSYTHLRPNFFMQNFSTYFLGGIRDQQGIFLPAGDASVSCIDIRDIAAVAALALTETGHEGKAYTLTGGQALTHTQIAETISKATGKSINYVAMSDTAMHEALSELGWPDSGIQHLLSLFAAVREGSREPISDDVENLLERPPISFEEYALDYKNIWL